MLLNAVTWEAFQGQNTPRSKTVYKQSEKAFLLHGSSVPTGKLCAGLGYVLQHVLHGERALGVVVHHAWHSEKLRAFEGSNSQASKDLIRRSD